MTNLEWVLENQEELIRTKLHGERVIDVALGKITLVQLLAWNFSVNVEDQKLVKAQLCQEMDKRYIYYNKRVEDWLQAERKEKLDTLYNIGTTLVGSDGNWYWYVGIDGTRKYHIVVSRVTEIDKPFAPSTAYYTDDLFKRHFKPLSLHNVDNVGDTVIVKTQQ